MRTKKFLFATTFAMMAACMMMNTSCTEYVDDAVENGGNDTKLQQACNIVRMVNSRSIMGATGDNKADTLVYKSNYDSQKKMELLCLQERGRELCYEGKRWYDLVRYSYRPNFLWRFVHQHMTS